MFVVDSFFVLFVVIYMLKSGAYFKLSPMPLNLLIQPGGGFRREVGEDGISSGTLQTQQ